MTGGAAAMVKTLMSKLFPPKAVRFGATRFRSRVSFEGDASNAL